ncbi:MAG: DUF2163 domain-containing protein [Ancalomicrobiaceae bacterium]|nr:DUF2163 domain-containing protein [Ancalomicrobiaceae bacterium]
MKTLPTALAAHLATGSTTMAYCWKVTRRDGTVSGYTEHDADLTIAGTAFSASTGFTASQIEQSLGLQIDHLEASGALSSTAITEADLLAGRYDDATIELIWVNWADTTQYITILKGSLGEVKREGLAFTAELRSLSHRLNQKVGQTFQRFCSAALGDSRCGIDLTSSTYRATATATSSGLARQIAVSGISGYTADWFTNGMLTFTSGANNGLAFEVKVHQRTSGVDYLQLWLPPPFAIAAGDTATVVAGCLKNFTACKSKFNNHLNFRGFPHIPASDVVTRYGTQGVGNGGGSLLGS